MPKVSSDCSSTTRISPPRRRRPVESSHQHGAGVSGGNDLVGTGEPEEVIEGNDRTSVFPESESDSRSISTSLRSRGCNLRRSRLRGYERPKNANARFSTAGASIHQQHCRLDRKDAIGRSGRSTSQRRREYPVLSALSRREPLTVVEIMRKAGIDDGLSPEILDSLNSLRNSGVVEIC